MRPEFFGEVSRWGGYFFWGGFLEEYFGKLNEYLVGHGCGGTGLFFGRGNLFTEEEKPETKRDNLFVFFPGLKKSQHCSQPPNKNSPQKKIRLFKKTSSAVVYSL